MHNLFENSKALCKYMIYAYGYNYFGIIFSSGLGEGKQHFHSKH